MDHNNSIVDRFPCIMTRTRSNEQQPSGSIMTSFLEYDWIITHVPNMIGLSYYMVYEVWNIIWLDLR